MTTEVTTIIGAGVAGLCVASALTRRDVPVRIVDQHGAPAGHSCSWWAGGMLAPFCEGETAEEPVVRLGQRAADWWERQDVPVMRQGSLVLTLSRDTAELEQFARRTTAHEWVDAESLATLEPALAGRARRGLFFPTEAHLAPRNALACLVAGLAARGVMIETAATTTPDGVAAPYVATGTTIDCRGLSAADALTDLRGVKGEMLMLRSTEVELSRPVRLLHPRIPIYLVPRGDGVFMLGATQIEAGSRGQATVRSVLELLSAAYALHPAFGEAEILEIGVDARPAFPDNLPRVRRRGQRIFVNGLFRHGFLLAPVLAEMVADFMIEGVVPEVMDENNG